MARNKQIPVDKMLKISAGLPHGTNVEVIKKTGYSPATVSKVRHGKAYNAVVITALLEIYEQTRADDNEVLRKLDEVIN